MIKRKCKYLMSNYFFEANILVALFKFKLVIVEKRKSILALTIL